MIIWWDCQYYLFVTFWWLDAGGAEWWTDGFGVFWTSLLLPSTIVFLQTFSVFSCRPCAWCLPLVSQRVLCPAATSQKNPNVMDYTENIINGLQWVKGKYLHLVTCVSSALSLSSNPYMELFSWILTALQPFAKSFHVYQRHCYLAPACRMHFGLGYFGFLLLPCPATYTCSLLFHLFLLLFQPTL